MKILISTPLFPPEVAYPAVFTKEFSKHLLNCGYDVLIATFSDFPEKIDGVKILHIKKSQSLFLRLIKFYFLAFKYIPTVDLIILKQAGISSLLTLLVSKIFRKKIILKMKEDEVETRIKNQKLSSKSFTIWRTRRIQQFVFTHVDFILFSDEKIKKQILNQYKLHGVHVGVLEQPSTGDILHYGDEQSKKEMGDERISEWKEYTDKFLEYAKN